jgi:thiamine pyrophosphate-dependent acetolactate synthase large subunit-like protein
MEPLVWAYSPLRGNRRLSQLVEQRLGLFKVSGIEPFDTAVRHKLPLLCVISLNGGWTADPEGNKPGRYLGYTRYDKMAEALGRYAE